MTFTIETIAHGRIEGRFFSIYTFGFRFGEHAFATQNLHKVIRYLAENPQRKATNLLSFHQDVFWDGEEAFVNEIMAKMIEGEDSYLPELSQRELDRFVLENQGRF